MSALHARIKLHQVSEGRWNWVIEDMNSRHGLFMRLDSFEVIPGMQFVIGGTKISVRGPQQALASNTTNLFQPFLDDEPGARSKPEFTVGSYSVDHKNTVLNFSSNSSIIGRLTVPCLEADSCIEPQHVRIVRSENQILTVHDNRSLNGTWLRIKEARLADTQSFLIGEQRFIVQTPK